MATERKKQKKLQQKKARRKNRKQKQNALSYFYDEPPHVFEVKQLKMSAVLEDFVEPYLTDEMDFDSHNKLYTVAVAAWNIALMPAEEQEAELDLALQKLDSVADAESIAVLKELIQQMIARKVAGFDHIKRLIVSYDLSVKDNGCFYLQVASTLG